MMDTRFSLFLYSIAILMAFFAQMKVVVHERSNQRLVFATRKAKTSFWKARWEGSKEFLCAPLRAKVQ
jgi:hypothetical protein